MRRREKPCNQKGEMTRQASPDSAADSGKTRFGPRKLPPRRRKSYCNQQVEPIFAAPAGSGNRTPFAVLGSGPAEEFSAISVIA
jgi:hypothetical protein